MWLTKGPLTFTFKPVGLLVNGLILTVACVVIWQIWGVPLILPFIVGRLFFHVDTKE